MIDPNKSTADSNELSTAMHFATLRSEMYAEPPPWAPVYDQEVSLQIFLLGNSGKYLKENTEII